MAWGSTKYPAGSRGNELMSSYCKQHRTECTRERMDAGSGAPADGLTGDFSLSLLISKTRGIRME